MVYATIRKWGNSYGIILPAEFVHNRNLSEKEVVEIDIRKKNLVLKELFGTLKRSQSAQKIKDELRAGWDA